MTEGEGLGLGLVLAILAFLRGWLVCLLAWLVGWCGIRKQGSFLLDCLCLCFCFCFCFCLCLALLLVLLGESLVQEGKRGRVLVVR